MTGLLSAAFMWGLVLWTFLRGRLGLPMATRLREISFRPNEAMSAEQLFGCLLSANFALLMHDNFNRVASALPEPRVRRLLEEHWGIVSQSDCLRQIEDHVERLGVMSLPEMSAIAAWLSEPRSSGERAAIEDCHTTMKLRARLARVDELRHSHLSVLAWDIQQLAYLIRLARAVDLVSQDHAEILLDRLAARARTHFGSWNDYSLSALVGVGMRGSMEIFETSEWETIARTHSVLLDERHSPIGHASSWCHEQRIPEGATDMAARMAFSTSHID